MRPDGTRVRDLTAIMQALPYVMPKRYDAQNWAEENLDEDAIRDYIRAKRREGRTVTHMSLLVSAYYRAVLKNPKINYFVMNRRIYKRNHFCFSFVILKTRADGTPDETSLKVYLEPEDTVFTVTEKIRSTIEKNQNIQHNNDTDRFAKFVFGVPGLACAALTILAMACGSEPFGYDYLYPLMPPGRASVRDGFVRSIWSRLAKSGEVISRHEA